MYPLTDKLYVSAQVSPADLAEAAALGINTLIAAELLPEVEAVMVRKLNEQMEGGRDG